MTISSRLRQDKTRAKSYGETVFNASGSYPIPYGKTVFQIRGQGRSGNYDSGGNYAGTNPPTGGNYAGTNPSTGGNYAGTNPPTGGNYATTNPGTYTPGNANAATYNAIYRYHIQTCPPGYIEALDNWEPGLNAIQNKECGLYTPGTSNPGNFAPGNPNYNPTSPGNAYYNPTVPGNAYYNPTSPGSDYYNAYIPGNPGAPFNVLGVTFPGGAANAAAPVIGATTVSIPYSPTALGVTVPSGAYVAIKNQ